MKRNHSAFKRSTSPVGVQSQPTRGRTAIPQADGGCLGTPDKESEHVPTVPAVKVSASNGLSSSIPTTAAPKMPHFLQFTENGKFWK